MLDAKTKNIIDMAISFTGMTRVFKPKSSEKIRQKLMETLGLLDKEDYEKLHSEFCDWLINNITTASGSPPSYGQAAKIFDIAMKVIVSYCHLPEFSVASRIKPHLHCAVDTKIMLELKRDYHFGKGLFTLSQVKKRHYDEFQNCLNSEAKKANRSAVDYDDILWRKLNRERNQEELP